jgi:hypothetical protein
MAHRYAATSWVNGTTAVSAANMNNIETAGTNAVDLSGDTMTGALNFSAGQGIVLNGSAINGETASTLKVEAIAGGASSADLQIENNGNGFIRAKLTATKKFVVADYTNGDNGYIFRSSTGPILVIQNAISGNNGVGFQRQDGTRIAEHKGNGDSVTVGSWLTGSGNLDTFHVAETIEGDCPQDHVMCPDDQGVMRWCEHEACPFAVVSCRQPGLGIGVEDDEGIDAHLPAGSVWMALAGRVPIATNDQLTVRTWVTSNGKGGVRAAKGGELAMGYALASTTEWGRVLVLLKPYQLPRRKR